MARYRIMDWNTWVTGPESYGHSVNSAPFISYLAAIAAYYSANVIVLQEVSSSVADRVSKSIVEAMTCFTGREWKQIPPIRARKGNRESYLYLWQVDAGFSPFEIPSDNDEEAYVSGIGSNPFPNSNGLMSGRKAAYVPFKSTDTGKILNITNYHAPADIDGPGPLRGLIALSKMPELTSIPTASGTPIIPNAVALCGDYNLNISNPDGLDDYNQLLMTKTNTKQSTIQETHFRNIDTTDPSSNDLIDYTNNGFDNIFCTNFGKSYSGIVTDLLSFSCVGNPLAMYAADFSTRTHLGEPAFEYARYVTIPIQRTFDSYILVRYGISDHLPVIVDISI